MSEPPAGSAASGAARSHAPVIIGWREWIALPDFGIRAIKAKIDTGAASSAIHAFDVQVVEHDGRRHASFEIHPNQRSNRRAIRVEAPILGERSVRSSTGHAQTRYVVQMNLVLLDRCWTAEVTLARRDQLGFRMLLGREALRGRFLVDPDASFVGGRRPRGAERSER